MALYKCCIIIIIIIIRMTCADTAMNPQHFGSNPIDPQIRINPEIWIRIADHLRLTFRPWSCLCCLSGVVYFYLLITVKKDVE